MKIKTHRPNSGLWLVSFSLALYWVASLFLHLPYGEAGMVLAAILLLIGTTIV